MSDQKLINVQILTTEDLVYEGQVDRISSFNEIGAFDIYPMHANFISIIGQKVTLYLKHKIVKEMTFEQAVLKVKKDVAYIFLGIEVLSWGEENPSTQNTQKSPEKK
jgi:F0F1-type ATP synthase epsilon subunit